ncbi:hypothetical protein [Tetragenococcus halophilus]|uniref:hypothetical protein n=1 Tax=Tetragenococcus halophilus TaxID=51669 RepID=UPI00300F9456
MADYRSENDKFTNKQNYKDLNMSLYPNFLDTRKNNINMRGFTNIGEGHIPDYVMAEYVNAINDGLMGLQRSIGETPMVYEEAENINETIENFTVSKRISRIEKGLFDERYGGKGWKFTPTRPTLNNHHHTGTGEQPPQINLKDEVTSTLNRNNINLEQTVDGLLATEIIMSLSDKNTVAQSIEDKLSKSRGGTVKGDTAFTGLLQTSTTRHLNPTNIKPAGATKASDSKTASGYTLKAEKSGEMIDETLEGLEYGYYSVAFRLRTPTTLSSNESILIKAGGQTEKITSKDLTSDYKQFFIIVDINNKNKGQKISVNPTVKTNGHKVLLDNIVINPTHPAILDR